MANIIDLTHDEQGNIQEIYLDARLTSDESSDIVNR